ncbi:MAG TPA: Ig-like domain-containing protein, partial [Spirochaetales bacterium]|nr:Ig-like domain-containing protein [Spirochaetales bacterium]
DSAGNATLAGPINVYVDPNSDLPVITLANPLSGMIVRGDLNIVGTCVDDDNMGSVEVRLDDREWVKASGTNYWSYYLTTADVADGLHTLYARGVDEFGVTGDPVSVQFHLDRTKPLHTISQPAFGTLVSGKLTMSGTVYDANGLKSVFYSIDGGDYWEPLKYSLDKKTGIASFSLNLDTRKMPDGPSVVWFKSTDGVGSEGIAVFLYFIDNTPPELAILSPRLDESVNGSFTVTGRVRDTVGVTKLSWVYGKDSGTMELVPGNPYFSIAFEAPASGKVAPVFSATDVTGNVVSVSVDRLVEPRADLARVSIVSPVAGSTVDGRLRVSGGVRDDDGVSAIEWRLDGGQATQVPGDGSFSFFVPTPISGQRVLEVRGLDATGAFGPWERVPFTYVGSAPKLLLATAVDPAGERAFQSGMSLSTMEGRASISGTVESFNALTSLSYSINGAAPVNLPLGKGLGLSNFTVPLPSSLPYGVLSLVISAVDAAGKERVLKAPVYAINYTRPRVGPLLDFADAGAETGGQVSIAPGSPMAGAFIVPYAGEDIASVVLEPATPLASVEFDGNIVRVVYKAEGTSAPTLVKVRTTRGHTFQAGPYVFKTDAQAPTLAISEPAFGAWIKGAVAIKASAQDGGGMDKVEYSLNGGEWLSLAGSGAAWSANAQLTGLSGPVFLELRARDKSGNLSYASTAFMADSDAPAPRRLLPLAGDAAGGSRLFAVKPGENPWSIAKIELGKAGSFTLLDYAPTLFFEADPRAGALVLRVTDKAGNVGQLDLVEGLDKAAALAAPAALESLKTNVDARTATGAYLELTGADAV